MRVPLLAIAAVAVLAAACGSKPPPPAPTPGSEPASSSPSSAPSAQADAGPAPGPSIESQRDPFMQSCMAKMKSSDYCDCGFTQFKEVFKDADMTKQPAPDDPRLVALQKNTLERCASKLPEDIIKATFLSSCEGEEKRMAPYCECAWPALRKSLAAADFVNSDFEGPRFLEAKKAMVAACKGKFPADIAKNGFMNGCNKGNDAAQGKVCECKWKKLRAKFSNEELVAGTADLGTVQGLKECK